jgi:hypothetical protein
MMVELRILGARVQILPLALGERMWKEESKAKSWIWQDSMVVKISAWNPKSKGSSPATGTRRENVERRIKSKNW